MEWLNEHSGLIALVSAVILICLIGVVVWLLLRLHGKIAVQRLNFLGFYSVERETGRRYAGITIGNKSLNDVGLDELGVQNGKVNFPLTEKFKRDKGMPDDARVVVEQRSSVSFDISYDELKSLAVRKNGKSLVHTLRVYAVDLTGTLYRGKIPAVKKLLKEILGGVGEYAPLPEKAEVPAPAQQPEVPETDEAAISEVGEAPAPEDTAVSAVAEEEQAS